MTSAAEYEAGLCQLEEDPPDIRQFNANIPEERWTHLSLEGATVDIIQMGEALAIFERDLSQISRAAALYVRAKSARLLRAVPNCRLVLMLAHHMLSPALSAEEAGLMTYLQAPPDAGPSVSSNIRSAKKWKCEGG